MVACLGVACAIETGRPVIRAVSTQDGNALVELFRFAARSDDDWALQLRTIQSAVATELRDRDFEFAVVRHMDFDTRRRLTQGVANRIAVDGVVTAVARVRCQRVKVLTGREIGDVCSCSKEDVLARAALALPPKFVEAGAAALAAFALGLRDA
jgi:hypothetical protein